MAEKEARNARAREGSRRPRNRMTAAVQARICRGVALGKALRKLLKAPGMPQLTAVMEHLAADAAFAAEYGRARKRGIELHIDDILDLADSATPENAQAVRLRVDTRKWLASKLVPRVYGDRLDLTGDVQIGVDVSDFTQRERARRIAFALREGELALDREGGDLVAQAQAKPLLGLPAPAPDPIYRDATPPSAVRQRHPGGINPPDESREEDAGRVIDMRREPPPVHHNAAEQDTAAWFDEQRRRRRRDEA